MKYDEKIKRLIKRLLKTIKDLKMKIELLEKQREFKRSIINHLDKRLRREEKINIYLNKKLQKNNGK